MRMKPLLVGSLHGRRMVGFWSTAVKFSCLLMATLTHNNREIHGWQMQTQPFFLSLENARSSSSSSSSFSLRMKDAMKSPENEVDLQSHESPPQSSSPPPIISAVEVKETYNVVLTHVNADFDSLAGAVGLAKLWSNPHLLHPDDVDYIDPSVTALVHENDSDSASKVNAVHGINNTNVGDVNIATAVATATAPTANSGDPPKTYVVLPRGAHPSVSKFLTLHKQLFPIRSLRTLPSPEEASLDRLGLVDFQSRDRLGPADFLLERARRITVVDHHYDVLKSRGLLEDEGSVDYVVDSGVGSVTTLLVERLMAAGAEGKSDKLSVNEVEATLLALGIHADTGSLRYDNTTPRDARALAWAVSAGASQPAISEVMLSAGSSYSSYSSSRDGGRERRDFLTRALLSVNTATVEGTTVASVLLNSRDGFVDGLAAVTQDALELTGSDVLLLAVVYDPKAGRGRRKRRGRLVGGGNGNKGNGGDDDGGNNGGVRTAEALLRKAPRQYHGYVDEKGDHHPAISTALWNWKEDEDHRRRRRYRQAFRAVDADGSGRLDRSEVKAALGQIGVDVDDAMATMDADGDGTVDFEEFLAFCARAQQEKAAAATKDKGKTNKNAKKVLKRSMIIIGRVGTGVHLRSVNLNHLFAPLGGGGHPKAASASVKLSDITLSDQTNSGDSIGIDDVSLFDDEGNIDEETDPHLQEARGIVQDLVEKVQGMVHALPTVGDFMTSPVLSADPNMTEKEVEALFDRYDVRHLPVVDKSSQKVIGIVTYKELAAAKQRSFQRRFAPKGEANGDTSSTSTTSSSSAKFKLKAWMKNQVITVPQDSTVADVEALLLEVDVGCIPVVEGGGDENPHKDRLVGMVTRTDLLRQHRYYPSLHYHNKGFSDSIAARAPIIELRKRLKKFDDLYD